MNFQFYFAVSQPPLPTSFFFRWIRLNYFPLSRMLCVINIMNYVFRFQLDGNGIVKKQQHETGSECTENFNIFFCRKRARASVYLEYFT